MRLPIAREGALGERKRRRDDDCRALFSGGAEGEEAMADRFRIARESLIGEDVSFREAVEFDLAAEPRAEFVCQLVGARVARGDEDGCRSSRGSDQRDDGGFGGVP